MAVWPLRHGRGVQFIGEDAVDMGGVRESPQSGLRVLKKGESKNGGRTSDDIHIWFILDY